MRKNERILPDTNVVLRYLLKDVPEQFAAVDAFFEEVRLGRKQAKVLESVLVECLYVLTKFYGVPREKAAAPLIELLHYKGVVNDDTAVLVEGLKTFAGNTLDPVDCMLAAQVRLRQGRLFPFDKALNKAAGTS